MITNYYYSDIKRALFIKRNEFLKNKNIKYDLILFGDSIVEGFNVDRFGGSQKKILNSAIGGDILEIMNDRLEEDVLSFKPKEVLFLGGINDIRKWYNEERTIDDIKQIVKEVYKKYINIVEKCLSNNLIIYPCLLLVNSEDKKNYPFLNIVINEVNNELINFFENKKIKYVNFNTVLKTDYGFLSRNFSDDGLHPNDLGNFEMYKILKEIEIL